MMIDTIFMCFLEDSEKNDGVTKPYFMSRGLMVGEMALGEKGHL